MVLGKKQQVILTLAGRAAPHVLVERNSLRCWILLLSGRRQTPAASRSAMHGLLIPPDDGDLGRPLTAFRACFLWLSSARSVAAVEKERALVLRCFFTTLFSCSPLLSWRSTAGRSAAARWPRSRRPCLAGIASTRRLCELPYELSVCNLRLHTP